MLSPEVHAALAAIVGQDRVLTAAEDRQLYASDETPRACTPQAVVFPQSHAQVVEIVRLEGRTPLIFIEIPGTDGGGPEADTVLLYGHLDKQP
ncbi:MAG: hypothetical protein ACK4TK_11945, partial [Thiobacillaceae bacterium]